MDDKQKPDTTSDIQLSVTNTFVTNEDLSNVAGGAATDDTLESIAGGGEYWEGEQDSSGV
jgi:hypothetical protein